MDDWCIHDQHGADVNSGGGRGADDNLHPTDFEHSHQEELAQAGMVRLFYDDGDGRYFLLMMIPGASSDNALAVLTMIPSMIRMLILMLMMMIMMPMPMTMTMMTISGVSPAVARAVPTPLSLELIRALSLVGNARFEDQ